MSKKLLAMIPAKGKTKEELKKEIKEKLARKGMLNKSKLKIKK